MKNKKTNHTEIDGLLKNVLKEDLPPESESRMKRQFAQFRKAIEQPDLQPRRSIGIAWRRFFRPERWRWVSWIQKKEVLAFSSVAMLVTGGFMHLAGQHSVVAESVSRLNTLVSVSDEVRNSESMDCTVHMPAENGEALDYSIQWPSPNVARVNVRKGNEINKTLRISDHDITITDHIKNMMVKAESLEQIEDLTFQPVIAFLSPNALAELLYRTWQLKRFERQRGQDRGIFTFTNHEGGALLEMTVNLNSYLPLTIQKFLPSPVNGREERKLVMQVEFSWNQPASPQLMIPKIIKEGHSA